MRIRIRRNVIMLHFLPVYKKIQALAIYSMPGSGTTVVPYMDNDRQSSFVMRIDAYPSENIVVVSRILNKREEL